MPSFFNLFAIVLLTAPLIFSQTVQDIVDSAGNSKSGIILLPSKTFNGRDDPANCNVQVNSSHALNGIVTISGSGESTTIDCSGTGMRCLSATGVSVIIRNVKFIGNRAMFPQPEIPAAPASHESNDSSDEVLQATRSGATTRAATDTDTVLPTNLDRASSVRDDQAASSMGILPTPFSSNFFRMHPLLSSASPGASVSSDSAATTAADPVAPFAGGCILIYNVSSIIIQDSSFLNCASTAVGGSVAILLATSVQVARCTFTDSLVNVVNSSYLSLNLDNIMIKRRLSRLPGAIKLPGGAGYGGSLFVLSTSSPAASIVITRCSFLRSQVLAVSKSAYDFSLEPGNSGSFLQGGAIAAFPPIVNKSSASSTGYSVSITESSFAQCLVLNTASTVPLDNFDVVMGGAISIIDSFPSFDFNSTDAQNFTGFEFYPLRSRVSLQEVTFSGMFRI
jgi:hypothetical protein